MGYVEAGARSRPRSRGCHWPQWPEQEVGNSNNTVSHNRAAGIVWTFGGGPESQLGGNVTDFSGTAGDHSASNDGIQVVASTVTVVANQADNNIGYGIQATGATDGGANVAAGNKGPAQCVGVVCLPG